ncbi:hypothetical protein C7459_11479 [Tumebacillus permanentifrigoris]|uniref:Uncharacterized protein n=1 Tax=Tumebacillus permanentifrigoris TaxID=378543 RepID=A0A316D5J1_9BACL|nr:hypothetical protein C7459_11479 [Tumebacillus permanentifrigoris]
MDGFFRMWGRENIRYPEQLSLQDKSTSSLPPYENSRYRLILKDKIA